MTLFGGKVFFSLGDFCQVAPVVKGCGPTATYKASIWLSHLWPHFKILRLEIPVRNACNSDYLAWVDAIGEGTKQSNQFSIAIALDLIDELQSYEQVIEFLFPFIILDNYEEISRRSFLSPLNIHVDELILCYFSDCQVTIVSKYTPHSPNFLYQWIIFKAEGVYYSYDCIKEDPNHQAQASSTRPLASGEILEYLALLNEPGIPAYKLTLKVSSLCVIMRNFYEPLHGTLVIGRNGTVG